MKAALVYAKRCPSWRLIQLRGLSKIPLLKDWPKLATNDPDTLESWPDSNIGVACGEASGFFVLDVDPRHGGDATLAALEATHGALPRTVMQRTPSGGLHYLFKSVPWLSNSASKLGPGLDIRATGGQIVISPSRTEVGVYSWINAPWDTETADASEWLLDLLRTRPASSPATPVETERGYFPPASVDVLDMAREALDEHGPAVDGQGGGLHTVHAAAILTHDFALTDAEAWPLFCEWNDTCRPPWDLTGGTPDQPDLRIMLGRGLRYGKLSYGCKRELDIRAVAKRATDAWAAAGAKDDELVNLLQPIRELIRTRADPIERDLIQQDLLTATGKSPLALALPRGRARAPRASMEKSEDKYGLDATAGGVPHSNLSNMVKVLEVDKPDIWLNSFTGKIIGPGGEWSDTFDIDMAKRAQRQLGMVKMTPQTVNQAVMSYAAANSRDPVLERLESLHWDGTERIAGFFEQAFGVEASEYVRAASGNFWRSLAARALDPGCQVDYMVVLEGGQGEGKSSACRAIVGTEYFGEATESPASKDFYMALQGKLLVEFPELDALSKSEVATVKRCITTRDDQFRAPYGRAVTRHPRRCVFVGSTNDDQYLKDQTGNRRFWPIRVRAIDLEYIRANQKQMFAEAVAAVRSGETWWEMPVEETLREQEARRELDPWEDILEAYLSSERDPVRVSDLLLHPLGIEVGQHTKQFQMRVATILRRIGMVRATAWIDGQVQKVWQPA